MVIGVEGLIHGTTTVGITVKDGVVLAADKRASAGLYIAHKKVKKIIRIDDHVAMTTAGVVADAQVLASLLQMKARDHKIATGRPIPIKSLAAMLGLMLNTYKYYPYIVQLLLGGYDESPKLYAIEWFGDYIEEDYAASGSGSPIAIGVIESEYSRNMSIDDAVELAVKAVRASIKRDAYTGEAVDVAIITKDTFKEMLFKR